MTTLRNALIATVAIAAPMPALADLTLYSGRGETLVAPIIQAFSDETGIEVNVRYAGTAELAILLQEEGDATPADLFWAQDATALGSVAESFAPLPESLVDAVPTAYRDAENRWVATSGRGRVLAHSIERVNAEDLPATMDEMTDAEWEGRVALAPTNGSFVAHITAMRTHLGDEATAAWLEGIKANDPVIVSNNTAILQAIADGEADIGIVNNYYLNRFLRRDADFPVTQTLFETQGDIGNLLLVAGIGILNGSDQTEEAQAFVEYLLSPTAQQYFTGEVSEFPVIPGTIVSRQDVNIDDVVEAAPQIDLNTIGDLEGTLDMLREAGLI
ncbi:MAG: iron(III) transport system substrate-binding protein [Rhodobacteraceae bacterium HLUCCA12]|nr:MAG: iron(III) transport system substrate-binding protein [Rhodobacteraceae bacterium HLUCCA12]